MLALLTADSQLLLLPSDSDQYRFPSISQLVLNDIMQTKEGKAESVTAVQLLLQKQEALPGMHQGNIMKADGEK